MMNNEPIIRTENLTRSFGENLAVDRLSLAINSGEVFGLLGPNGAGKTTTVRMLAALLVPTSGEAFVAGFRVGKEDQKIRRIIGLLPEAPGLYDGLSAEQNLAFYGAMYEVKEISRQIKRYLELLGLWNRRYEPVATFSKGMRQKLAIARALLHEPEILFLDEPTSGLDPQAARLVREFIAELKGKGRTIILCTHNLEEADRLCDRVAVINGHLLALDSPKVLRRKVFGRKVVFHLAAANVKFEQVLQQFDFVSEVQCVDNKILAAVENPELNNPALIKAVVEAGGEIQFVGELRRRLEDVYLELMGTAERISNG
ncbi:MAG: ABC transporter ATP-binding protein [Anaerolineales bacterium]